MSKTITPIKVTDDKAALTALVTADYAAQHAGKTHTAVLNADGTATYNNATLPKDMFTNLATGMVTIIDMDEVDEETEEELYEVTFEGTAEDYGFSDQSDELEQADAYDIAREVAEETNSAITWEGSFVPSWFF